MDSATWTAKNGLPVATLVRRAETGSAEAVRMLKRTFPRREFRKFWCDLKGPVLKWREKGSKATWKTF